MSTVRDLVKDSLLTIGVIASGENVRADVMADAIRALNRMLGSWSLDGFLIYQTAIETFSLVASQASYTMGTGGNFDTTRPTLITGAGIIENGSEYPIDIISVDEYQEIKLKTLQSNLPCSLYPKGSFPLETILLYPVPSSANQIKIYSNKELLAYASANDDLNLPPGYEEPIMYGLAGRLCPQFGKQMTPDIAAVANDSLARLQRQNTKPVMMKSDYPTTSKRFNFVTGGYD